MLAPLIIKNESIEIVTSQKGSIKRKMSSLKNDFSARYDPILLIPSDPIEAQESLAVNNAVNEAK